MDKFDSMYKQFDLVQLITTKNIKYLSSEANIVSNPRGIWSVVGFIGQDALLSSGTTLIRIPVKDMILYAEYKGKSDD